jgi:Beta-lactamase enzyme family
MNLRRLLLLPVLVTMLSACEQQAAWPGSVEALLASQPQRFSTVLQDPEKYRVQIIYTQIDREANNAPQFRSFEYRVDEDEYFYPASTVKLPTALVALEKLRRLGIPRDAVMLTGSAADFQTPAEQDETAPNGLPSVAHYIRKILLVSDNDAFNRLYEFIGQESLNYSLVRRGLVNSRIVHRLESVLTTDQNLLTNPVRFIVDGDEVHSQDAVYSQVSFIGTRPQLLGVAEIIEGERVDQPKDFSVKNAYPLRDQHNLMLALMFPEAFEPARRFDISADDLRFVHRWMSTYPAESGIGAYADSTRYPPGYVKFLMYGGKASSIPEHIRIFNKVGDAYGFLTDTAYVVDFRNKVEFVLSATIYTNDNQTFNDGEYEYDEIGLPFLRDLGQAIYEVELARSRTHAPDLAQFSFSDRGLGAEN